MYAESLPICSLRLLWFLLASSLFPRIYRNLRDFLDSNEASNTPQSSRRVINTLAANLYEEAEYRSDTEVPPSILPKIPYRGVARTSPSDGGKDPAVSILVALRSTSLRG